MSDLKTRLTEKIISLEQNHKEAVKTINTLEVELNIIKREKARVMKELTACKADLKRLEDIGV